MIDPENAGTLATRIAQTPKSGAEGKRKWRDLVSHAGAAAPALRDLAETQAPVAALLAGIAEGSPFLWRLCQRDEARLADILAAAPEAQAATFAAMARAAGEAPSLAEAMRALRAARAGTALLVGLADCAGALSIDAACRVLTEFADAAVQGATRFALREAIRAGTLRPLHDDRPEEGLGLFVLAFGKHGAGELNYSSDIDLAIFYDPAARPMAGLADAPAFGAGFSRMLVKLLQERTPDGYVLRVDLRLRPDPSSTPVAVPLPYALHYYETVGQNWERAAMIKARPAAGDLALGKSFLAELTPFVWRKYFDFAAIADIQAMKRQIYTVKGHADVAVIGHDVKLGRGGIREIEFFAQTQQLIYGGRRPALRTPRTLEALDELVADKWLTAKAAEDLKEAYRFLRRVEHRIQMVEDEQTQRLPNDADRLAGFARFFGMVPAAFEKALLKRLRLVETHYARLFEDVPGLASSAGSLVFTGVSDDPETLKTLRKLGFRDPPAVAETVRGWHFGRRPAVMSARAREVLTELVPAMLESFGKTADPDTALRAFDEALGRMPAAVELFLILRANEAVRHLFADILGSAPRLAETVARSPHALDAVLDPELAVSETPIAIETRIATRLARESDFEIFLDLARTLNRAERFSIATAVLSGEIEGHACGRCYTAVAEAMLRTVLPRVQDEFALRHGILPGGRHALIGYGKLGTGEMTATSDLDLVVLYDAPADAMSDGAKPLFAAEYYAKLTQRLISAVSAPMRNGVLYDIDLRLRPSGKKGPVAISRAGFLDYQARDAELWEHMALSRARPLAGDATLCAQIAEDIAAILARPRKPEEVRAKVAEMRGMIAAEKPAKGRFDFKLAPGGLIDIEFIVAALALQGGLVPWRALPCDRALEHLAAAGALPNDRADSLAEAWRLQTGLSQFTRFAFGDGYDLGTAPAAIGQRAARMAGLPDFRVLSGALASTQESARAAFTALIGKIP